MKLYRLLPSLLLVPPADFQDPLVVSSRYMKTRHNDIVCRAGSRTSGQQDIEEDFVARNKQSRSTSYVTLATHAPGALGTRLLVTGRGSGTSRN